MRQLTQKEYRDLFNADCSAGLMEAIDRYNDRKGVLDRVKIHSSNKGLGWQSRCVVYREELPKELADFLYCMETVGRRYVEGFGKPEPTDEQLDSIAYLLRTQRPWLA